MSGISSGVITGDVKKLRRAIRQNKAKQSLYRDGLVQVNVWVHTSQASDLKEMARVLRKNDDLSVGPCRSTSKGCLVSWQNYTEDE